MAIVILVLCVIILMILSDIILNAREVDAEDETF